MASLQERITYPPYAEISPCKADKNSPEKENSGSLEKERQKRKKRIT